jgi:hypothetical protein
MKTIIYILVILFSSNVFASSTLLFSKSISVGFTLPQLRNSTICLIYNDKIENRISFEGISSFESRDNVKSLIQSIIDAEKNVETGPSDSPTTTYSVYTKGSSPSDAPDETVFEQWGSKIVNSEGEEAAKIKNFIDALCSK